MIRHFHPSPPTVGLELEWQLVRRATLDLEDGVLPLIDLYLDDPCVKPEVIQTSVETITPPMPSTAALRPALVDTVTRLSDAAARLGMALVGAGTHPFCERLVPVTPLPRYLEMARSYGHLVHTQITYSLQVHVGMPSGEVAVRVLSRSRALLPVLLGLSASSPLFHGEETAFASYRHRILAATRSYGVPPAFEDWGAFVRFLDTVERANMFGSFRDMHWDIRLRPDLGTIEIRPMDAQPTIADSLALGALAHSLLVYLIGEADADPRLPGALPWWIEKENAFRASNAGLDAEIVFDAEGRQKPLRQVAMDLIELVAPEARALGEEEDLARARAMIERGTCSGRQIEVFRQTRSAKAVEQSLADDLLREIGREALGAP
ncbi:MAG: YbdK family carboxylate-amine ligase [Polyangiaceae bacterium]|nr:YbdK family carboxylate-amine ligase [Polyangiaceae bacterium]